MEWYRVLKPGGTVAMILIDTEHEKYDIHCGPFKNPRRQHCYTALTIRRYLERAKFTGITVEKHEHTLRAKGVK
jgi:predicted SAM-dependent methyltransferase